jgi:hypothetical protein
MTFDLNIAPMSLDDTARDGESQPCAARAAIAGPRSVAAIKTFKDMWNILRADAFARIADGHFHA